jgi:hypothetical protein
MPKGVCAELTGMVFGRLTVIKRLHATERGYLWLCRCTCGNEVTPATGNLTRGNTASCGCLKREMVRDKNLRHGLTVREHRTPEMDIFHAAKRRCENPNDQRYSDYAAHFLLDTGSEVRRINDGMADVLMGWVVLRQRDHARDPPNVNEHAQRGSDRKKRRDGRERVHGLTSGAGSTFSSSERVHRGGPVHPIAASRWSCAG